MPDEERDESLGLEHLPQSELEATPQTGKQPLDTPDQTNDETTNQGERGNQFVTENDKKDEIPL